jgi:ATP/maltotriose-dependent transcriptional regulator MalT
MLVDRESELGDLEQQLLEVAEHGAVILVVEGVGGVGRSTLLRDLAQRQARGPGPSGLLWASAVSWETERPYAVLTQLLGGVELPTDPFAAADTLAADLSGRDGPTLVVVDDAHWCDAASLQALATLVRHHGELPVLVVLTRPTDLLDVDPVARDLVNRIPDRVMTLGPLNAAAIGTLAARRGLSLHPSLAQHLSIHTSGIPRHVVALLEELPAETWIGSSPVLPAPSYTEARVRRLLDGCRPDVRALVEAVAILEPPVALPEAAALVEVDSVLEALDDCQRLFLLCSVERLGSLVLTLPDPMIRAAVLTAMGPARRSAMHARAALVVEDRGAALSHAGAAAALPDADLAEQLDALSRERSGEGAWGTAADLLIRASRVTVDRGLREDRLVRAVDALVGAGDAPAAMSFTAEVEGLRETPMRNAVLGYLAIIRGRPGEAETRLSRAWELVNAEREPEVAAIICHRHVLHSLARCSGEELVMWADRAIELVGAEAPIAVEAAAIRGLGLAATGRVEEALENYRVLSDAVRHGAVSQRIQMGTGWLHLQTDHVDEARAELESALPTDVLGGSNRISLWAHAWLARTLFATGEWDAALRTVDEALVLVSRSGMDLMAPLLHWTSAQIHSLRGEWERAEEDLRLGDAGAHDYEIMRVPACLARAHYAEARADYAGVLRALEPLTRPWARGRIDEPGAWPWPDIYANALVLENRHEEAANLLDQHEQLALERGHRSAQARLAFVRGRLEDARGEHEASWACFERGLALIQDLPLRYDRARGQFIYGQTLRRAGKRREADAMISAARASYLGLGATAYVRRCDRELKAGGLNAVRGDRAIDALTPQEQAVSDLVASGLSNREVAAELFLAEKTVQYHLTRVYAKLGVRSRAELAALRS